MIKDIRDALADFLSVLRKDRDKSENKLTDSIQNNAKSTEKAINIQKESVLESLDKVEKAIREQEVAESVSIKNPEAITGDLKTGLEGIIETLKKEVKNFDKTVVVKNDLGLLASAFKGSKEKKDLLKGLAKVEKAIKNISYPEIPDNSRLLLEIAEKTGNTDVIVMLQKLLDKEVADIMDVNLDPNLIEDDRVKTILPDDQVNKMSQAFVEGRSGSATEDKQDDIITLEQDKLHDYKLADIDETDATYTYIGYLKKDGAWYILRIESDENFRYVKGDDSYNWSNRASESYDTFNNIF